MAGSYPNVPSRRMAWDEDSALFSQQTGSWGTATDRSANRQVCNDESNNDAFLYSQFGNVSGQHWVIFPELRELDGIFGARARSGDWAACETSGDTTNGFDGSWVTQFANFAEAPGNTYSGQTYRTAIVSMAVSNVRSVRQYVNANNGGCGVQSWHLFGEITPGYTPDRILYIDTGTALEFGLPIDYGDVPRGSASDYGFKVRNNSSSLTANTVQITAESLYLSSGNWYSFSEGGAFQSTLPLGSSIGPSSDSPALTLRRIIPDSEQIGLHAGRVQTSVGSWT